MELAFTGAFEDLVHSLGDLGDEWDISQPGKKVLRHKGCVLNWFESTGTISFQGSGFSKLILERQVRSLLYPDEFPASDTPDLEVNSKQVESVPEVFDSSAEEKYLGGGFDRSELVIGLVSAVGTETARVVSPLMDRLRRFGYTAIEIRLSSLLGSGAETDEYDRIRALMASGDLLREYSGRNGILGYGASKLIFGKRKEVPDKKVAYIVNSLKHPDEVEVLRKIYGQAFYLFGVHADKKRRLHFLENDKGLTTTQASELISIDEGENIPYGQRTRDTYHRSDFFLNFGKNDDHVKNTLQRFLELIFSHPFKNPTFDEFAMFMAFTSSVRSGDLSRQVGAVITRNQQIIATGANECPASGGGLYWAEVDAESGIVEDVPGGKDYTRNEDSNRAEQNDIVAEIVEKIEALESISEKMVGEIEPLLRGSRIKDLTEFGRVVHAEMEALLSCAREGISSMGATLYCTTFPCHNCAKHIIASGISRVVYVEPYPKSKALEFHSESIELKTTLDVQGQKGLVGFEPFTGVGARRFLDLFSMNLGVGNKLRRKTGDGTAVVWSISDAVPRVSLLPDSYMKVERAAAGLFDREDKNRKSKSFGTIQELRDRLQEFRQADFGKA